MATADPDQDIWARLRAYCQHGHASKYPPLTEWQAHGLEQHGVYMPSEAYPLYTSVTNGFMTREQIVLYPPATEEQVRETEERLGFSLPTDLRRLYMDVANGGINLGPVEFFLGAIGGCGEYAATRPDGQTIEAFANDSGWQLHPRIEEALLRHSGRYIVADSLPKGCVWIGQDSEISVAIDLRTGYIYCIDSLGALIRGEPGDDPVFTRHLFFNQLMCIELVAPSLSVWFERWIDGTRGGSPRVHGELSPEMIETADLPDPDAVWRGFYRFGLAKRLHADDGRFKEEDRIV